MRRRITTGLAVLSASAVLAGAIAPARAATPYPNVFVEAGYTTDAVDARIEAIWQQLFHGQQGNAGNGRRDGQTLYYELSSNMAYVEDIGNQDVRSEGMGFAMMIAAQLNKKTEFDALWNFAKSKMQIQSGNTRYFFNWHVSTSGGSMGGGVAPDGDQWIAAALAIAGNRWSGGSYKTDAYNIIHAMPNNMFPSSTHLPAFSPPGAMSYTDPSYCLPVFYKIFGAVDTANKSFWDQTYSAAQTLLQRAYNKSTGLVPDYSNWDGSPWFGGAKQGDDAYSHNFQEDAWRAIANANVDASWYGVQSWQTQYSNTLEAFFASKGITSYGGRYHLDGSVLRNGQNNYEPAHPEGLVAMNAASAISATNSARLDFVKDLWNTKTPTGTARYYDGMLYLLGHLYLSGKFRNY